VGFKCEKRPPGVPAVWETNFTVQPSPVASPNPGGITGYQPTTSISIITSGDVWGAEQQGFCLPGIYLNFPLVMVWQGLYVFLSFMSCESLFLLEPIRITWAVRLEREEHIDSSSDSEEIPVETPEYTALEMEQKL
jgi:hypothetical protein